jgi:hypothetical protein
MLAPRITTQPAIEPGSLLERHSSAPNNNISSVFLFDSIQTRSVIKGSVIAPVKKNDYIILNEKNYFNRNKINKSSLDLEGNLGS